MSRNISLSLKLIYLSLTSCIFLIMFCTSVFAECKECKALRKAKYLGIKKVKQYVQRSSQVTILSSDRKAKKRGLKQFKKCAAPSTATRASTTSECKPAFAILQDGIYFCPKQLKAFSTEARAEKGGFAPYDACGARTPVPTPTATPQVTPRPLTRSFSLEAGTRLSDVDAISISRAPNDDFRLYTSASASSIEGDTLRFADSADGLTFGATSPIIGIAPEIDETFTNPATLKLNDGSYVFFFEEIRHISSAALDISSLMRAQSVDGSSFSYNPDGLAISNGSSLASLFYPSVVLLNQSELRLYYNTTTGFRNVTSSDLGLNFNAEVETPIFGRGDSFAPFPSEPAVLLESSGSYLMFFTSPISNDLNKSSVFLAESNDGTNFYVFDEPILSAQGDFSYSDPAVIALPDNSLRLYIIERSGTPPNHTRSVISLRSLQ